MRNLFLAAATLGVACAVFAGCGEQEAPAPPLPKALTRQQLIDAARPAIVAIRAKGKGSDGLGSGVLISPTEVVTVAHVPHGATAVEVKLHDGTRVGARIKGSIMCSDLALLELNEPVTDGAILPLASDSAVEPGSDALLLSYQANIEKAARQGISINPLTISNPNVRKADMGASFPTLRHMLGFDGNVGPGASGAPPLSPDGNILGLISLGLPGGESYAVRVEQIRRALPQLRDGDRRDDLGMSVTALRELDLGTVFAEHPVWGSYSADGLYGQMLGTLVGRVLRRSGVRGGLFVDTTEDAGPADKGELVPGDLITHVAGVETRTVEDLCGVLESTTPGQRVTVRGYYVTSAPYLDVMAEPWKVTVKTRR